MRATRLPNPLPVLAALALLSLPLIACAQVQITASVDRDALAKDETLELTVSVTSGGMNLAAHPSLPSLQDFRVINTASQQSISLINGAMHSSVNYVYDLQPTRTGRLTIGAVKITVEGQTYRTAPIIVTVTPPMRPPSGAPPSGPSWGPVGPGLLTPDFGVPAGKAADVKHAVDHKTAYVGQQITYTFTFMQAEQLFGNVEYSPADMPGFVAEDLPNPPQGTENVSGRLYSVQRRQKALFGTAPGKHTIGQAGVTATVDPLLGPEDLVAQPIAITVLPLPQAGQPPDFAGAVGTFTVRLKTDQPVVRAGETLNCTVDVAGNGNIRTLGAPRLVLPDWVRVYKKAGETRSARPGGGGTGPEVIGGVASFSYLLLPRQAGTLTIPPVSYSYFDPQKRAYLVARGEGATITVVPGGGGADPLAPTDNLRPIKMKPGPAAGAPLAGRPWFWIVTALPLLAVLRAGWQRWREVRVLSAPRQVRAGNALALAHKRIALAEGALDRGRPDEFYQALNTALLDYVADRTGAPTSGLTADLAHELLLAHGAEAALADLTRSLIERAAAGRFAPGASEQRTALQLAVECRQTLTALQRQVRPDA